MATIEKGISNRPYLLYLNQIEVTQEYSGTNKSSIEKLSSTISKQIKSNLSLPLVCLTDKEDKYHLLTGLPIYEAAKIGNLEQIWVFLIVVKQSEAEQFVEQALLQSKLNERVIEPEDVANFLNFINKSKKSNLILIPGVKDAYARLIFNKRPYASQEDMQQKLGAKRCLNWLRAYKQAKV
ncbi:hypothetical protein CAL7716_079600 [Calothrix sp. PCC 7716]|nr:hypothetical protein CAL7716_079600 [Calothrix sp. PCC 7716]